MPRAASAETVSSIPRMQGTSASAARTQSRPRPAYRSTVRSATSAMGISPAAYRRSSTASSSPCPRRSAKNWLIDVPVTSVPSRSKHASSPAGVGSERDVVVRRASAAAAAATAADRRRGEVVGGDRHVALGAEPVATVAVAEALGAREELDVVGDDVDRLALVAVLVLELPPLQATVDRDRTALGEVLGGVLALAAPDRHIE